MIDLKDGRVVPRFTTVRRAPEPSDIWWENTTAYGKDVVKRRLLAWSFYTLLLLVAFAVQFVLAVLAEDDRSEVQRKQRTQAVRCSALLFAALMAPRLALCEHRCQVVLGA